MSEKLLKVIVVIVVVYAITVTVQLNKERNLHQQIESELISKIDSLDASKI